MIILICGASHTGKTALSQRLMERLKIPYMSLDHLKMGLIRSGMTELTPLDDDKLTEPLWKIVREIIKTAIENEQNMIIEGCYFPGDFEKDFTAEYLRHIHAFLLCMTDEYIERELEKIIGSASVIEKRLDDSDCTKETLLKDNRQFAESHSGQSWRRITINDTYDLEEYCNTIIGEVNCK